MQTTRRTPSGAGRPGRPGAARSGTRPGGQQHRVPGQRSPASSSTGPGAKAKPKLTGRMAILVVVFAVLVVSYASSLRAYRNQQGNIAALRTQIASSSSEIGRLEREKTRWNDQAYVEQQARARFGWVLPGEVAYQVVGRDGKPLGSDDRLSDPNAAVRETPTAWWAKEYDSLAKADHPPSENKQPPPATKITPTSPSR